MSQNVDTKGWSKECLGLLSKAVNGSVEAQFNLGLHYLRGVGVPENHKLAVEWLTKSADKGFEDAEYLLGTCYDNGTGVPRDMTKALLLYEKSARAANKYAQFALGEFYTLSGKAQLSFEWYKKAARQQYPPAFFELGRCYYYGLGCMKDEEEGIQWLQKSAAKKHEPAIKLLSELGR